MQQAYRPPHSKYMLCCSGKGTPPSWNLTCMWGGGTCPAPPYPGIWLGQGGYLLCLPSRPGIWPGQGVTCTTPPGIWPGWGVPSPPHPHPIPHCTWEGGTLLSGPGKVVPLCQPDGGFPPPPRNGGQSENITFRQPSDAGGKLTN